MYKFKIESLQSIYPEEYTTYFLILDKTTT
uniref:Uncharacterized protein n=1 Tax=Arundo donax TaxID=35708 RepID=A0A0A9F650_ARUDO